MYIYIYLSDYIDNIQTNILHNNNIHINAINDTQPCETINSNVSNSYCYDLYTGPRSQNNIDLTNKTNILQYILDLHPSKYILPSLQLNIQNFNFDNIQNLIDLDYEQIIDELINTYIVQSKKKPKILRNNIISNNTKRNDNIGVQSNRNIKRKQRCLLFDKTQQMYSKNRSRLAKSIFDGEDITKEINEIPIDL